MKRMWLKGKYWKLGMKVTSLPFQKEKKNGKFTLDWSQSQYTTSDVRVYLRLPKNMTRSRRKKVWDGVIAEMRKATDEVHKKYGIRI